MTLEEIDQKVFDEFAATLRTALPDKIADILSRRLSAQQISALLAKYPPKGSGIKPTDGWQFDDIMAREG